MFNTLTIDIHLPRKADNIKLPLTALSTQQRLLEVNSSFHTMRYDPFDDCLSKILRLLILY